MPIITLPGNVSRVVAVNGNPTTQTSKTMPGAFFYRMIGMSSLEIICITYISPARLLIIFLGPKYFMTDPFDGDYGNAWRYPYPNNDTTTPWNIAGVIHWNDWKPITGENVWAGITGPIQVRIND